MGVDVFDVGGAQTRILEGLHHGGVLTRAGGVGLHEIVPVGGDPGAGEGPVDAGPAGLGGFEGLDDEEGSPLTEDEAVPAGVPRAGGALRFVIAAAESVHVREGGHG